jgi:phosphoribosylglycinamide formyltransferase-1
LNWAVFISGNGSNLQVLLDHATPENKVCLVVTSNPSAYGVQRAEKYKVPVCVLPKAISDSDWIQLSKKLCQEKIDYIFLLGFLKIVPAVFLNEWENKILNLHPSLLPAYAGLKSIERSYQDGAAMGVTVHWVDEGLDEGKILLQEKVIDAMAAKSQHDISLAEAEQLIHQCEHKLVLKAVGLCQKKQG